MVAHSELKEALVVCSDVHRHFNPLSHIVPVRRDYVCKMKIFFTFGLYLLTYLNSGIYYDIVCLTLIFLGLAIS